MNFFEFERPAWPDIPAFTSHNRDELWRDLRKYQRLAIISPTQFPARLL
jgi:hypothetical protein